MWNDPTWSYSDINSPNFGIAYSARATFLIITGHVTISIDAVNVSVCYTIPTSVETLTQSSTVNIYPNPTKGMVTLQYQGKYLLQVYDLAGKELYQSDLSGPQNVDLSFLSNGMYFMHITSGSEIITRKLVVQK